MQSRLAFCDTAPREVQHTDGGSLEYGRYKRAVDLMWRNSLAAPKPRQYAVLRETFLSHNVRRR